MLPSTDSLSSFADMTDCLPMDTTGVSLSVKKYLILFWDNILILVTIASFVLASFNAYQFTNHQEHGKGERMAGGGVARPFLPPNASTVQFGNWCNQTT